MYVLLKAKNIIKTSKNRAGYFWNERRQTECSTSESNYLKWYILHLLLKTKQLAAIMQIFYTEN